ncbi:MAG: triose-phosphate isomerase [Phycisphaerales bacterium]|nr:triose-phosphate isomerase [Phycisphaerales bacterium]
MRKPLVVANWKMNLDLKSGPALARDVADGLRRLDSHANVDVAVCPPATMLATIAQVLSGTGVAVGAQDAYFEPGGAFTGEVSAAMVRETGATYLIVGHSERRHTIGHLEDDRMINLKLRAAQHAGLLPILCVGETLGERQAGQTLDVLTFQLTAGLVGARLTGADDLVVAYEPVWAIGTGLNATAEQAQEAHRHLRNELTRLIGPLADAIRILYGGSLKPDNADSLLAQPDVDGGLVGGASLKAESFLGIIRAAIGTRAK